jgi:hypothetical protein
MVHSVIMPQYYFHIRDYDVLLVDELGLELSSFDDAVVEARRGIASMLADAALDGDDVLAQVMEITDSAGAVVIAIPFRDVVNAADGASS